MLFCADERSLAVSFAATVESSALPGYLFRFLKNLTAFVVIAAFSDRLQTMINAIAFLIAVFFRTAFAVITVTVRAGAGHDVACRATGLGISLIDALLLGTDAVVFAVVAAS